jgi:hypothetical protein
MVERKDFMDTLYITIQMPFDHITLLRYTPQTDGRTNYQTIGQTTIDISKVDN